MLYVSTDITKFNSFFEDFRKKSYCIDLSKIPVKTLADECETIVEHHNECCVFLGYLEPGWMLDSPSQTRLRKLFRKFPVAFVCHFLESLPLSWKNEIDILYSRDSKHGTSTSIDDGSAVHDKPEV
jgi:hypothetical protein